MRIVLKVFTTFRLGIIYILTSSQVSSNTVTLDDLLSMLIEESDHQQAQ